MSKQRWQVEHFQPCSADQNSPGAKIDLWQWLKQPIHHPKQPPPSQQIALEM